MSFSPELIGKRCRQFLTPGEKRVGKWMKKKKERSLKRKLLCMLRKNPEYDGYTTRYFKVRYKGWIL